MRHLNCASAFGLALLAASPALAADLPGRFEPLSPVPLATVAQAFDWTGVYGGLNAGFGRGVPDVASIRSPAITGRLSIPGILKPAGFSGGVQAGYNYQYGAFVFGIEGDLNLGSLRDSIVDPTIAVISQTRLFGTLRPRIGVVSMERLLVYATAGYAFAQNRYTVAGGVATPAISQTSTYNGYAVGGGLEYAFTDHLSVKLESIYHAIGKKTLVNATRTASTSATPSFVDVRLGVNYKY